MTNEDLLANLNRYKFYHIIPLRDGISTPGNLTYVPAQRVCMKYLKSLDLTGKRVLDIGCRDGLFSFAAESQGAAEIIGIDNDLSKPATEFLIPYFNSNVRMYEMNLYDLRPDRFGLFDTIVFPGVLYHLRYPFWGLKCIRDVMNPGADLIIETAVWDGGEGQAMLYCPIGDDSPYEATSCSFFNPKGLADTLASLGFETLSGEFVGPSPTNSTRAIVGMIKRFLVPPAMHVRRYVHHCVYRGFDNSTAVARYWHGTHRIHTEHGGGHDLEEIPNKLLARSAK